MSVPDDNFAGKKVFFVHPSSVIQKDMVAELIRQEYEVQLVPGADEARLLFHKYPDALAFLNIDEGLDEEGWEAFVDEVSQDSETAGIGLGILTYNADPALAQRYLLDRGLRCGFIKLSLGLADSTAIVLKALEANEARGRRRYLRVHCAEKTLLNWNDGQALRVAKILDLSSVGLSCTFEEDPGWPLHGKVEGVQLKLKGALCLVDGIVMGSRPTDGGKAYIVLFDPKTSPTQKDKIRAYVQWSLQAEIEADLRSLGA